MLTLNFPRLLYNINMGTWPNTDKWDLRGSLPGKSGFLEKSFFHNNKGINVLVHSLSDLRCPCGKELRMASGQLPLRNWSPQSNRPQETEILPTTMWAWKQILPQWSLKMTADHLTPWLQQLVRDPETEGPCKLHLDSWPKKAVRS